MRFSGGVDRYHEEKKKSILNSVLDGAQGLPSNEEDREGIIMSTNRNNSGAAVVKTNKSWIIVAACAVLMLGGAIKFLASENTDGSTEIKTSPGTQPIFSTAAEDSSKTDDSKAYSEENSKTDESSETSSTNVPVTDDGTYPTITPETVIEPDDRGIIEDGFEGYDIEVKYLLEDPWKGLKDYAQHSYGVVIDVTAKDGYELPWNDEAPKRFSHFGDLWIDNGHTDCFWLMDADAVVSYGYKTQNEKGEDVLRFVIVAEVDESFELDKDTRITFDVNVVFWGVGEIFKTDGKFTASVTFDKARALDLDLTIPYQMGSADETEG